MSIFRFRSEIEVFKDKICVLLNIKNAVLENKYCFTIYFSYNICRSQFGRVFVRVFIIVFVGVFVTVSVTVKNILKKR